MASKNITLSKQDAFIMYKDMVLVRKFEEKCAAIYGMGKIAGFCHLAIGQEAVCAGFKNVMKKGDSLITAYRCHGHALMCGTDPQAVMGELMGKVNGASKGKGGSMHIFDTEKGFFGGHGIVGAQVPLGTGMAFANKYENKDNITFTCYGDGAANQGQIYEAFNMAKLWDLPVLYVVENNRYAMGTSLARHTKTKDLYTRGLGYGIPGEKVDGMDVLAVIEGFQKGIDTIRKDKTPYIIEMDTYRYRGHSMSDPAKYRSKEELSQTREERDPIATFAKFMIKNKFASQDELDLIDEEITDEVERVYEVCDEADMPDEAELFTEVYSV